MPRGKRKIEEIVAEVPNAQLSRQDNNVINQVVEADLAEYVNNTILDKTHSIGINYLNSLDDNGQPIERWQNLVQAQKDAVSRTNSVASRAISFNNYEQYNPDLDGHLSQNDESFYTLGDRTEVLNGFGGYVQQLRERAKQMREQTNNNNDIVR